MADTTTAPAGPGRGMTLALGILFMVGGLFLLGRPGAGSVSVTLLVGWTFILGGVLSLVGGLVGAGTGSRWWGIIGGLLIAITGVMLVSNPLKGTLALTSLFTIWLLIDGIVGLIAGFMLKDAAGRGALIASSAISLVLGIMLWNHYPSSATWVLGTYAGVVMLMRGMVYLFAPAALTKE